MTGTGGWEVLYKLHGRVHRVQPPGSWPVNTWREDLLGYASREQERAEEEARVRQAIREGQRLTGPGGSTPAQA